MPAARRWGSETTRERLNCNLLGADAADLLVTATQEVRAEQIVPNLPADCLADQDWTSRTAGTECVACS